MIKWQDREQDVGREKVDKNILNLVKGQRPKKKKKKSGGISLIA